MSSRGRVGYWKQPGREAWWGDGGEALSHVTPIWLWPLRGLPIHHTLSQVSSITICLLANHPNGKCFYSNSIPQRRQIRWGLICSFHYFTPSNGRNWALETYITHRIIPLLILKTDPSQQLKSTFLQISNKSWIITNCSVSDYIINLY